MCDLPGDLGSKQCITIIILPSPKIEKKVALIYVFRLIYVGTYRIKLLRFQDYQKIF